MTQPEATLLAACIAAVTAIASLVASSLSAARTRRITTELQRVTADRTREAELVVNALNHLVGGSQERAAGLAALSFLKSETPSERWAAYENSVRDLLVKQLIFVLTAGRNRWEAHEVENVREIANWFINGGRLDFGDVEPRVRSAVDTYVTDWNRRSEKSATPKEGERKDDGGGRPNTAAVTMLIADLNRWLLRVPSPAEA